VHAVLGLAQWLAAAGTPPSAARLMLSLAAQAQPVRAAAGEAGAVLLLSGPEGGLAPQEEELALAAGFRRATLGPRVLRAETAPLAALVALTLAA
jgi:16S rRNA (uracil1498-N3)-methyltransferase